jgi:putative DNA primase/helicase
VLTFSELEHLNGGAAVKDVACPACSSSRKAASNRVRRVMRTWNSGEGFISYNCSRCGEKGYARRDNHYSASRTAPRRAAAPAPAGPTEEQIRKLNDAREIWRESVPAAGTVAEVYLKGRGCWTDNAAVRFVSASPTLGKYWWDGPAMVAAFGVAPDDIRGIHVTKLKRDGAGKAGTDRDKIMLGSSSGWPIVLTPVNDIGGLLIAEGIENALACHASGLGLWAAEFDRTKVVFDKARLICREAARSCNERGAAALASRKTVWAVLSLAATDRRIAATSEQWDADPWLLNTPDGVIDLKTGVSRPHRAEDYMTKMAAVSPLASCPTPLWLGFLNRITKDDADLVAFLQRMAGYSLTGFTDEHAMFFCYGTGANGKTKFLNVLTKCVANYHRTAPIETFTDSHSDRHPTDLAGLRGARLVTAVETEEGRRWAESKIKALTGGDTISARFMRQDFFEYRPQFKLIIAGNHKPGLRSVDEAIRRRLNLIPFAVTIPPAERDRELPAKLDAELPGILQWMVEGCLAWQRIGLAAPAVVTDATKAYLEAEDAMAAWLEECCCRDPQAWEQSSALFANWSSWAVKAGEQPGQQKRFTERLEARGIEYQRRRDGRGFAGLRLKSTYENV